MQMFAIYDKAISGFMTPFFLQAKGEAIRQFLDAAQDPETPVAKHPEDFQLFYLGHFDNASGEFVNEGPDKLITGLDVIYENSQKSVDTDSDV